MFGSGILRGLGVTLKHTIATYTDDFSRTPTRYEDSYDTSQGKILKQPTDLRGIVTIQYPEEKREIPENFRYIPMLIYEEDTGEDRCTACGICAKVCPPQCIWIVRDKTEEGKPLKRPSDFYIDASICMSCGFCAEYCPFDAIKMNHDYELATYDRFPGLVFDKEELSVPTSYYAALYPAAWAIEEEARAAKAAKAAARQAKAAPAKKEAPAPKVEKAPAPKAEAAPAAAAPAAVKRAKPAGGHWSPIPEGYTGEIINSDLPLPPVPAEGVSPSGVSWARIMELREKQLLSYRERRKSEGKEVKL
ncbi:MAG: NADH-quinone oxidoreductase subunit I [Caldilineales bacterium]|nr:NADH-quinone oxidoreductase subunit I [Caldilineales bacterium]